MTDEILAFTEGKVGRLRLNRPKAIHALNEPMCRAMMEALVAWRNDPNVELVLLDHAEGRGFCAGGDVRAVAESGKGDGVAARAFFHTEYQLNHLLFTYAKPVVSFLDGIVMGGGVGIGMPAKFRVATERTIFAMPEATIGLFPDVSFPFVLRVDRVVPDATGRVVARSYSGAKPLTFDPDTTNNSAEVVVNPSV